MADAVKSIRIKTGSLRRLFKERAMYAEEVVNESAKLDKMKTEGTAGVAQQENVLKESQMMVNDNSTRLQDAYEELLLTADHFGSIEEVAKSEEYAAARALISEVESALKK